MGEEGSFRHVAAVLFRYSGQGIIPDERRKAYFPAFLVDEVVNLFFELRDINSGLLTVR